MDRTAAKDEYYVRLLGGFGIGASASRAALAAFRPLHELLSAARTAGRRLASARSNELWQRTLAQAEATLSVESLVTAHIRDRAVNQTILNAIQADIVTAPGVERRTKELMTAAWQQQNTHLLAMSRRNLDVLLSKWRAGTLSALSVEERVFFLCGTDIPLSGIGARLCLTTVRDAVGFWPYAALDAAALRDINDAICALLEADAAGELFPGNMLQPQNTDSGAVNDGAAGVAVLMLCRVLIDHAPIGTLTERQIVQLVRDLGLSSVQVNALSALQMRTESEMSAGRDEASQRALTDADIRELSNDVAARAAAAEAKYGLQRCTLPGCAAQEPAARTYKKCGRCGQAYYCCVEHQQADWKRHAPARRRRKVTNSRVDLQQGRNAGYVGDPSAHTEKITVQIHFLDHGDNDKNISEENVVYLAVWLPAKLRDWAEGWILQDE